VNFLQVFVGNRENGAVKMIEMREKLWQHTPVTQWRSQSFDSTGKGKATWRCLSRWHWFRSVMMACDVTHDARRLPLRIRFFHASLELIDCFVAFMTIFGLIFSCVIERNEAYAFLKRRINWKCISYTLLSLTPFPVIAWKFQEKNKFTVNSNFSL